MSYNFVLNPEPDIVDIEVNYIHGRKWTCVFICLAVCVEVSLLLARG